MQQIISNPTLKRDSATAWLRHCVAPPLSYTLGLS